MLVGAPDVVCELADVGDVSALLDPSGFGFLAGPFMRLQASRKRSTAMK